MLWELWDTREWKKRIIWGIGALFNKHWGKTIFSIYSTGMCLQSTMIIHVFFFIVFLKYLSVPNSNFPGPFLRKLPLIQGGIVPSMFVGMGSGVSSAERTRGAKHSSPLACGHLCLLDTEGGEKKHWKAGKAHYSIHCVLYYWSYAHRGSLVGNMLLHTCIS